MRPLNMDAVKALALDVLSEQQDTGNWISDGNRAWDVVMTATVVRALKTLGLAADTSWHAPTTSSGLGSLRLAIRFLDEQLRAQSGTLLGVDPWDTSQALLARAEVGPTPDVERHARHIAAHWAELYCAASAKHDRWTGPAFLAAMFEVVARYTTRYEWARRGAKRMAKAMRAAMVDPVGANGPFPSLNGWQNEHRWNAGLVLRTLCEHRAQLAATWPQIDWAVSATATWLHTELQNCDAWVLAREAEGPMFVARALDGLLIARPSVSRALARRIAAVLTTGTEHLQAALADRVPNLKAKTTVLAHWAHIASKYGYRIDLTSASKASPTKRRRAQSLRAGLWNDVHSGLAQYVDEKGGAASGDRWTSHFGYMAAVSTINPFPRMAPIGKVFGRRARVALEPYLGEFEYHTSERLWRLSDGLTLAFAGPHFRTRTDQAAIIELFFLHEYAHLHHAITSATARQIGQFGNILEHVDFMADIYALLHALDRKQMKDRATRTFDGVKRFILDRTELIIRSFWAFERDGSHIWDVRRLRRHLNWYWRREQLMRCETADQVFALLSRKPNVEVAGFRYHVSGRRVGFDLTRLDSEMNLQIAILLENDVVHRVASGPAADMLDLANGIMNRDYARVSRFFRGIADALPEGAVLPLT